MPTRTPTPMPTPEGEDPRLPALWELTIRIEEARIRKDPLALENIHRWFRQEFRDKCDSQQFVRFVLREIELQESYGLTLEGATFLLDKAWIEGNAGYAEGRIRREGDGRLSDLTIETGLNFVWSGGKWLADVHPEVLAKDNPCAADGLNN